MNYWKQGKDHIYVAAHRGWSEKYPENTMEAFRAAIELGVDQIETDIRITADGELVLFHDNTLERTTNGTGTVEEKTFDQLRQLDAGSHKGPEFAGCRIPKLQDLFELVKDHPTMTLDLELKEYPTEGKEEMAYSVCRRVVEMTERYGYGDRIVLNTFSGKLHEFIRATWGDRYPQHVFFPEDCMGEHTLDPYSYGYCCCMFGKDIMAEAEEFEAMRARGVRTWAGAGVKDEAGVDMAIARGAELITCNNPDVILELLRQKNAHP